VLRRGDRLATVWRNRRCYSRGIHCWNDARITNLAQKLELGTAFSARFDVRIHGGGVERAQSAIQQIGQSFTHFSIDALSHSRTP
jgi:hypothetical protein